jgi:acyl-coenzyme A synthetase/AMP-(fatty) acid ligase
MGRQVVACVRLAGDDLPTAEDLSAYLRERRAAFNLPRTWYSVDAFPLTGKVQKFILRNRSIRGELTPGAVRARDRVTQVASSRLRSVVSRRAPG